MLIALLTMMLLSGSPVGILGELADVRDRVESFMPKDADQREVALAVLDRADEITKAREGIVDDSRDGLQDEISDHDAAAAAVEQIWRDYHVKRTAYNRNMIDLRFELKDHISREEWAEIFPAG